LCQITSAVSATTSKHQRKTEREREKRGETTTKQSKAVKCPDRDLIFFELFDGRCVAARQHCTDRRPKTISKGQLSVKMVPADEDFDPARVVPEEEEEEEEDRLMASEEDEDQSRDDGARQFDHSLTKRQLYLLLIINSIDFT
jgi:hypothetical protein